MLIFLKAKSKLQKFNVRYRSVPAAKSEDFYAPQTYCPYIDEEVLRLKLLQQENLLRELI